LHIHPLQTVLRVQVWPGNFQLSLQISLLKWKPSTGRLSTRWVCILWEKQT
jgi:hypothetical protein